jgi:IS5 family transposase
MATKDSISVIKFLQLGANESFSKDTLNRDINKVPAEVWEELNNSIIKYAKNKKIESGEKIRTDCFSTETNIHFPTDSNLIADVVRVLSRNMKVIQKILTTQLTINIPDRTKTTKSKLFNFNNTKKSKVKRKLQLELIRIVKEVLENTGELLQFINTKQGAFEFNNIIHGLKFNAAVANLITFHKLGLIVYNQAYQRNLKNAKLPASEKIVSIFEPHTDIIAKGNREVVFGHKICITTGESGLILNLKVLSGNPNDASILQEQLKTTKENVAGEIKISVTDGSFGTAANLEYIKSLGITESTSIKREHLDYGKCRTDRKFKRKLRNFRAGIEANISHLKRCFQLYRILETGFDRFNSSSTSSAIAYNLLLIARVQIKRRKLEEEKLLKKAA